MLRKSRFITYPLKGKPEHPGRAAVRCEPPHSQRRRGRTEEMYGYDGQIRRGGFLLQSSAALRIVAMHTARRISLSLPLSLRGPSAPQTVP